MSAELKPLVFVTGAAGFLVFKVLYQLLQAGYPVRGIREMRRFARVMTMTAFENHPQFEAVEITDIATSDFSAAFEGVGAIIHTAAPLPGRTDSETALKSAIEGSLHILREAQKAGVKKFVASGSMVTFPENASEKKFGEQAVLDFAEKHPEIDITIFCPPWIFGPFAPGFEHIVPEPDFAAFSTNGLVYQLLRADNVNCNYSPGMLDVRDVAHPHRRLEPTDAGPPQACAHRLAIPVRLARRYQVHFRRAPRAAQPPRRPEQGPRLAVVQARRRPDAGADGLWDRA
ncbi:hypothetical protein B0H13DRAFT_1849928 [Mycena leptocephala]|nr:hypothetical protein B0H13DRAFT_1849928 [Mycena leptocephala]